MVLGIGVQSLTWSGSCSRSLFGNYKQEIVLTVLANSANSLGVLIMVLPERTFLKTMFLMVPPIPSTGPLPWCASNWCHTMSTSFWISVSKQKTYLDRNCAAHPSEKIWIVSISFSILDRRNYQKVYTQYRCHSWFITTLGGNCDGDLFGFALVIVKCTCRKETKWIITKISTLNLILIPIAIIFAKIKVY